MPVTRIFIYEHTCASATGTGAGLDALRREGRAMLTAVVADFARLNGVEVVTVSDADEMAFRRTAAATDLTLVIAPEFDGILETRCRWVEEAGGRLLGPSSTAVRRAADKLTLGEAWRLRGLPSPPCRLLLSGETPPSMFFPAVCKPRYGAGSQATFLVRQPAELAEAVRRARAEGHTDDLIVQPFVPGLPASLAWLIGPKQLLPLPPTEQVLSRDGRFHYLGGAVPLAPELGERAVRLAQRAIEALPGLFGYVGVDLVLGEAADGSGDAVIELNPRLTTSYIGLRTLTATNLARLMLQAARGEAMEPPRWFAKTVRFAADGSVGT